MQAMSARNREHTSKMRWPLGGCARTLTGLLLFTQVGLTACTRKDETPSEGDAKKAPPTASPSPAAPEAPARNSDPNYLVPPAQYGERDFIRALLVDKDDVYFATLSDVYRVPLAGGAPVPLSKTPSTQDGEVALWQSGERLLTQTTTGSIFMASSKTGGPWTPFLEPGAKKALGGVDVSTRLVKGLDPEGKTRRVSPADFDGQKFYLALQNLGPQGEVLSSTILSVSLAGGPPKVVFDTPGEIGEVHRFGEKIVFLYTKLPSVEALAAYDKAREKEPYRPRPKGPSGVFALTPGQGDPRLLMPLSHLGSKVILVGDSSQVIVSGFEGGDFKKGGTFRVPLEGGAPQKVDARSLAGQGFDTGDAFVVAGTGAAGSDTKDQGEIAIFVPKRAGEIRQISGLVDLLTTPARALSGETLLLSRYDEAKNRASIVKVSLKGELSSSPAAQ